VPKTGKRARRKPNQPIRSAKQQIYKSASGKRESRSIGARPAVVGVCKDPYSEAFPSASIIVSIQGVEDGKEAIVDGRATINTIVQAVIPTHPIVSTETVFMVATGAYIHPVVEITLNVTWEGVERAVKFIVLESAALPIILGTRWTADVSAVTHYNEKLRKMKCIRGAKAVQQLAESLAEIEQKEETIGATSKKIFTEKATEEEAPFSINPTVETTETVETTTTMSLIVARMTYAVVAISSSKQSSPRASPCEIVYGQTTEPPHGRLIPWPTAEEALEDQKARPERIDILRTSTRKKLLLKQSKVKARVDKHQRKPKKYSPVDLIILARNIRKKGRIKTLPPKYIGPVQIVAKQSLLSYLVEDVKAKRKKKKSTATVSSTRQTSGSMASTVKWMDVNRNNSGRQQSYRPHHYPKIMSYTLVILCICCFLLFQAKVRVEWPKCYGINLDYSNDA
jgi:hypothetical protein